MQKYVCLNCGRIWCSGGEIMVIGPVCRSKLIKIKDGMVILNIPLLKNRPDLHMVELRVSQPPTPGPLPLSYKDLNGGSGESKGFY